MKIYCKKKLSKKSKKEFLHQYFDSRTPTTYYLDTTKIQCGANRNRSILDLKALLDGSFKTTTSKNKTIKLLMSLLIENKIKCLFCQDVHKIVFFNVRKTYWTFYTNNMNSWEIIHYGNTIGIDGYSFNQMLEIYNKK